MRSGPKSSVLIVDDEPQIRNALVRELRSSFEVATAASHDEALAAMERRPWAAVVSDFHLGAGRTGGELLRRLQADAPVTVRILISGEVSSELVQTLLAEGVAHRFIAKPWSPSEVRSALAELLADAHA